MQGRARFAWRESTARPKCRLLANRLPEAPASMQNLDALLDGFCPEAHAEEAVALNCNGRLLLLRLADVDWLEAAEDGVLVHVGRDTRLLTDPFPAIAGKLPPGRFVRIGPSTLVKVGPVNG